MSPVSLVYIAEQVGDQRGVERNRLWIGAEQGRLSTRQIGLETATAALYVQRQSVVKRAQRSFTV